MPPAHTSPRPHEAFALAFEHQPEGFEHEAAIGQLMSKWNALDLHLDEGWAT